MRVRSLTADEQKACRAKGAQKVGELLGTLKNSPETDRYDSLHVQFEAAVHALECCSVNFRGEEYEPVDCKETPRSEDELVLLKKTVVVAQVKALGILTAMDKSPLSRVNGTAVIFQECARKLNVLIPAADLGSTMEMPIPSEIAIGPGAAYK